MGFDVKSQTNNRDKKNEKGALVKECEIFEEKFSGEIFLSYLDGSQVNLK